MKAYRKGGRDAPVLVWTPPGVGYPPLTSGVGLLVWDILMCSFVRHFFRPHHQSPPRCLGLLVCGTPPVLQGVWDSKVSGTPDHQSSKVSGTLGVWDDFYDALGFMIMTHFYGTRM